MKKFYQSTIIFLFFITNLFSEDIAVKLSRNKVGMNESFLVEFISSKRIKEEPDFSPLEKDFDILSISSGFQTTIINGIFSEAMSWNLNLMPKNEGELILPSISFGHEKFLPQKIEVVKGDAPKKEDPLYIATEVRPKETVYQEMPLIYIVRLYSSHAALHGALSELKTNDENAMIKPFGPDKQYEEFDQTGKRRLVVERQYSVIPQKSGELIFYPIIFEGSIQAAPSFFNMQTNFKRIYSNQESVDVKPIPPSFQDHPWFPAYGVSLKEEWSKNPSELEVGEAVTWTVTLSAEGNFATQIPDISLNLDKSLKAYPDKPELSNELTATGFIGIKQLKIALIPQKAGEFILPELKVDWWDVKEEVKKEAVLSERKIHIQSLKLEDEPIAMNEVTSSSFEEEKEPAFLEDEKKSVFSLGFTLGIISFFTLGVISFFLYKKWSKNPLRVAKKAFKKACIANLPKEVEYYFLYLMKNNYPSLKPFNLMSIKPFLSNELQTEVLSLYRALYSKDQDFNGKNFLKAFYRFNPKRLKKKEIKKRSTFQELYPNS